MSKRSTASPMPVHPIRQKHGNPKHEDNTQFLDDLSPITDGGADVNARLVWNDHTKHTKKSGCHLFAFHGESAAANGFLYRMVGGHCVRMNSHDAHRDIRTWDAHEVLTWRKTSNPRSERPSTMNRLYRFVSRNGGTIVAELKAREFRLEWVMQQLVEDAARWNQPLWFKALATMSYLEPKAIATTSARVRTMPSGRVVHAWIAVIYGKHVKGRAHRLAAGRRDTSGWSEDVLAHTRIW